MKQNVQENRKSTLKDVYKLHNMAWGFIPQQRDRELGKNR